MRLDERQRRGLATALYGLGNIVAASLLIGQFVSPERFRVRSFVLGLILFLGTYIIATRLNREGMTP